EFMARGGNIAWGIVPTLELDAIASETSEGLAERWKRQALELAGSDVSLSKVLEHSIFTPSCGCGSLPEDMSLKVLDLLRESGKILAQMRE
ncbi:MAG: hypothetical protein LLG06_02650, partial [Desulfobacteraceae bacterium]|nr:hypothetical protein [Desulfobacteraceae bacterium]